MYAFVYAMFMFMCIRAGYVFAHVEVYVHVVECVYVIMYVCVYLCVCVWLYVRVCLRLCVWLCS